MYFQHDPKLPCLSVRWLLLFSSSRLVQCKSFLYDRVPTLSDIGKSLRCCTKNQPVDPGGSVVRLGSPEEEPNDPRPLTGFPRSTLTFTNSKCREGRFRFNLFRKSSRPPSGKTFAGCRC